MSSALHARAKGFCPDVSPRWGRHLEKAPRLLRLGKASPRLGRAGLLAATTADLVKLGYKERQLEQPDTMQEAFAPQAGWTDRSEETPSHLEESGPDPAASTERVLDVFLGLEAARRRQRMEEGLTKRKLERERRAWSLESQVAHRELKEALEPMEVAEMKAAEELHNIEDETAATKQRQELVSQEFSKMTSTMEKVMLRREHELRVSKDPILESEVRRLQQEVNALPGRLHQAVSSHAAHQVVDTVIAGALADATGRPKLLTHEAVSGITQAAAVTEAARLAASRAHLAATAARLRLRKQSSLSAPAVTVSNVDRLQAAVADAVDALCGEGSRAEAEKELAQVLGEESACSARAGKGTVVRLGERIGIVVWDGRPRHEFVELRWLDDLTGCSCLLPLGGASTRPGQEVVKVRCSSRQSKASGTSSGLGAMSVVDMDADGTSSVGMSWIA
eukprot:TRINITY_DN3942_c0_g1_i1.p1 TRINITY_DN3942_c0_g1~~TRINITY_DN3942_c0_g1_i1.p1  ORF type:complete len:450 (-),score=85.63 TRINITY_DN3942_c0_g1_i1:112-1461(-)